MNVTPNSINLSIGIRFVIFTPHLLNAERQVSAAALRRPLDGLVRDRLSSHTPPRQRCTAAVPQAWASLTGHADLAVHCGAAP
jgi:hypothetical protein